MSNHHSQPLKICSTQNKRIMTLPYEQPKDPGWFSSSHGWFWAHLNLVLRFHNGVPHALSNWHWHVLSSCCNHPCQDCCNLVPFIPNLHFCTNDGILIITADIQKHYLINTDRHDQLVAKPCMQRQLKPITMFSCAGYPDGKLLKRNKPCWLRWSSWCKRAVCQF